MSEEIHAAIKQLRDKIDKKDLEVRKLKLAVNTLQDAIGLSPMYSENDLLPNSTKEKIIRGDQFFKRPLATCVFEFIRLQGSVQTTDEIFDGLRQGGHVFEGRKDHFKKRSLSISLGKNPKFVRIGDTDAWGLAGDYATKMKDDEPEPDDEAPF